MATKWRDIRRTHSPEVEERIRRSVEEAAIVMRLYQLREARNLTQVNLAKVLEINQGEGGEAQGYVCFNPAELY